MRILQINVFNFRKGGSEAVYFNTTKALQENGNEVVSFSLKWEDNYPSEYEKYFPESKETRKGIFRHINNAVNYFYHFEAAAKMEELIKAEHPDIAQIHLIWGQITPSILPVLKRHGIPVIFTIHDYRIVCPAYTFRNNKGEICKKCGTGKYYNCFLNNCTKGNYVYSAMMGLEQYFRNWFFNPAKYADGLLYVSNFAKRIHEKYMPELKKKKSLVLYNTSDRIFEKKADSDSRYYLFFGRLSREKGISTIIDVFKRHPNLKLKIAGTGPEESNLKELARDAGNIEFLGYKSGESLQKLVREAYFTIVPSEWYENNPLTIIESYSAWVPVIGTDIGGIPEIIDVDKTGYIFRPHDTEGLEKSLLKAEGLSRTEYLELCENTHNFAMQNFNPDNYPMLLERFYTEVINNKA